MPVKTFSFLEWEAPFMSAILSFSQSLSIKIWLYEFMNWKINTFDFSILLSVPLWYCREKLLGRGNMVQPAKARARPGKYFLLLILCIVNALYSPHRSQAKSPLVNIKKSDLGIRLKASSVPLLEILQAIEKKSGTRFKVHGNVGGDRVSVDVLEKDWFSVINSLLDNYGTLYYWGDNGEIASIWVMREGSDNSENPGTSNDEIKPYQLRQLLHVPAGLSFPVQLFRIPQIQKYLRENGVHKPEDWENRHLAGKIRRQAEREFNTMLFKSKYPSQSGQ
jgi:hypothetical protein